MHAPARSALLVTFVQTRTTKPALPMTLLALAFATSLTAQYVSPFGHRLAEGLSNNVFPFGNTAVPFRFSQVHDDVPAMTVTSLAFRHNAATVRYAAHSITCDGWMSTAVASSSLATTNFDNNHGADKVPVIFNRTFNHAASDPTCVPGAWLLSYPLDVPFTFAGTPASICWEVHVTAKTQGSSVTHDAFSVSANPPLQIGRGGVGCRATGASGAMTISGTSTMSWSTRTGTLNVAGANVVPNAPAFHILGADKTQWFGLPLPFQLPGTGSAPSGPCYIYTDALASFPITASNTGTLTNSIPVPATSNLNGFSTLSQFWAVDSAANSWGIVTSPVAVHGFVRPTLPAVGSRIWLSGSLGAVGTFSTASWLITKFN